MKICSISDLHGNCVLYPSNFWKGLEECEVLFICGDILPLKIQFDMVRSQLWLEQEFKPWAEGLPVEKIFIIAGNHDAWFERNDQLAREIFPQDAKITYVKNDIIEYLSIQDNNIYRIFGTPYCHEFGNWPFMRKASTLKRKFSMMPENIDILFSHDAPYGTSDICLEGWAADGKHKGCPELRDAILQKSPKYCFHGHLHSTNHEQELLSNTKVFNTSILNEEYEIAYSPLIIKL